ncbi:MAG: hypothetical protein A4E74_02239 [Syntrophus sp. PtaB.Bin075]|nr:MAG: hypothetical protein A4E74_02239 [Syntrophus sp. PtaB.Bin075]
MIEDLELPLGPQPRQLFLQPFQTADDFILERVLEIFKLLHSPLKNDGSIIKSENPVGNKIYIRNFMTHQNRCKSEFSLVLGNHAQNRVFPDGILTGSRFIEQDDLRIDDERPRQGHSFLHAP